MINLCRRHVLCYVSTAVYVVMLDAPLIEMVVLELCLKVIESIFYADIREVHAC